MERATYKPLQPFSLKQGTVCQHPHDVNPVGIDTPAMRVMTDFQQITPVTIRPDATLAMANNAMISHAVRLLFVAEVDDEIIGVITARDTMGDRPITLLKERGGKREDLRVADLMTPHAKMEALRLSDVMRAEVGHILKTLQQLGRQHALVVEFNPLSGRDEIRGMFSATAIGRRLGVPIHTFEIAQTFAEIESALAES